MKKTIIVLTMAVTVASALVPVSAFASSEINKVTPVTNENLSPSTVSNQIQLIESKYLIRNSDGTFSINTDVNTDKSIDQTTLKQIKDGMDQINIKIKNKELASTQIRINSNENIYSVKSLVSTADAGNESKYVWHWYGFEKYINATESGVAAAEFGLLAAKIGAGTAISAAVPIIDVLTVPVGSLTAAVVGVWSAACWLGNSNGRGNIIYAFGAPSWAQIYNVVVQ